MQRNTLAHSSKLKSRLDGEDAASPESTSGHRSPRRRSRSRRRRKAPYKVQTQTELGAFFSVIKGILTIMLLAGGFYWAAAREYTVPAPEIADTASSSTAVATVNASPEVSASPDTATAVSDIQPEPETAQTNTEIVTTQVTPTDTTVIPNTAEVETVLANESADQDIRIAKIDTTIQTTTQNTSENITSNTEINAVATAAVSAATAENNTAPSMDTPISDARYTVKTYRATMFSNLSSVDATETPVEHGASVAVLERKGEWVKIKVENDGGIGYIHITQLSRGN